MILGTYYFRLIVTPSERDNELEILRSSDRHQFAEVKNRILREGLRSKENATAPVFKTELFVVLVYAKAPRDGCFHGPLSYATSLSQNMLSALGGLRNSRVFVGFSPETLMVQRRNGRNHPPSPTVF